MRRAASLVALAVLPFALALAAFALRDAGGRYWFQWNLDPSYPYLLNSLNVANLRRPFHTDHPGTTLQVAGAAVIRLSPLSSADQATARAVIADPEKYASRINGALIVFCALALLAAGLMARAAGGDLLTGLLAQAAPFLFLTSVQGLVGLRPEALLLAFSLLLAAVALLALRHDVNAHARPFALAFGLLVGLGVATKLTFAPLALVPLVVLPRLRPRVEFCAATAVVFLVAVSPILAPEHLRRMLGFVFGVATRTGFHGQGAAGVVGFGEYASNAAALLRANLFAFAPVALGALVVLLDVKRLFARDVRHKTLAALTVVQLVQLLVVAKHPNAHYLIPALGLAGCNLALSYHVLRERVGRARFALVFLFLVAGLFVAYRQLDAALYLRNSLRASSREALELRARLEGEFAGRTRVEYWGASSPDFALKFGLEYNGGRYAELIEERRPGRFFYNLWTRQFSTFTRAADASSLAAPGDWFLLHGAPFENEAFRRYLPAEFLPEGLTLENLHAGAERNATVYRARFDANATKRIIASDGAGQAAR
ncbi:MAG TPA: hypothetical protein VEQ42_12425 [Pyrinomonadaceae bacterium]|nr:hypothetical protein [Pyrinomonadaceae bacterium]